MNERIDTDVCVIGAGAGGLSFAAGAVQMGADVVLLEKGKMGGDCLNYGCVPSKAFIAAGNAAYAVRASVKFGIEPVKPVVNFEKVRDHVRRVIEEISPKDSQGRFEKLGVRVIRERGRFSGRRSIVAGDYEIFAKRIVISTGSTPYVPVINGLDKVPFFTNETIFDHKELIQHLLVIGGGPIGLELAQAYRRLGANVTVIEQRNALNLEDPELSSIVIENLKKEGVDIHENVIIQGITNCDNKIKIQVDRDGNKLSFNGSHLLIAAGRQPNIHDLNLGAAGINNGPAGISTNARMQTSNKRVFVVGDAAEGYNFTHLAGYQAGIAIRNVLFRLPARVDYNAMPRVTFTSPELAQVGLTEKTAREKFSNIKVFEANFSDNDKARTDREIDGKLKVITTTRGIIIGATMVGDRAGEIIQSWCLPISKRLKIKDVCGLILPYPTLGEINKSAAVKYYSASLFSKRIKYFVRFLLSLG